MLWPCGFGWLHGRSRGKERGYLMDFVQTPVVPQFDSNGLNEVDIVGVSV